MTSLRPMDRARARAIVGRSGHDRRQAAEDRMKRLFILAFAIAAFASGFAAAAEQTVPMFAQTTEETVPIENPVATYSRPAGWASYPDDNGVTSVSFDGKVTVSMILMTANDVRAAEKFGLAWYAKRRVRPDLASMATQPHRSIDHLETTTLEFAGRDFDGRAEILLTLVKLGAKRKFLMICVWGPPLAMKANRASLNAILDSVRMTKRAR